MTIRSFPAGIAFLFLLIGIGPSSACSGDNTGEPAAEQAEAPNQAAARAGLQAETFDLELPLDLGSRSVRAGIPPGWTRNPDFGAVVFQPGDKDDFFYPPVLQYSGGCGGPCEAAAIPGNIAEAISGIKNTLARPNLNTGDEEQDAVRADVEILLDERFGGDGWILAAAVTYPENLSAALYVPKIVVHAFRHHPGDAFFVQTSAHCALGQKPALLDLLVAACRATDY